MACLAILGRLNVPPFFQGLSDLLLRQPFLFRPVVVHVFGLAVPADEFGRFHIRGFPIQICDLVFRAQKILRMPVTFETPGHAVRLSHIHYWHVIHGPVATEAADPPVHMGRVIVIDVIDRAMEPDPFNRLARLPTFPDRLELRIILLHLLMTRHAGLRVRHIRLRRDIDKAVAITAIHSQLGNVNVVGKRDRLDRLVTDLGIFRGDVIPGAGGETANYHHAADGQFEWQPI